MGLFRGLKKLGVRDMKGAPRQSKITKEGFKTHFKKVSEKRFENNPQVLEDAVDKAVDLRDSELAREWAVKLNSVPDEEEIVGELKKMRDSSPGEDGVRLGFLLREAERYLRSSYGL